MATTFKRIHNSKHWIWRNWNDTLDKKAWSVSLELGTRGNSWVNFGAAFSLEPHGDWGDLHLRLGVPKLDIYLGWESPLALKIAKALHGPGYGERETGFRLYGDVLTWHVWHDPMGEWGRNTPWWRYKYLHLTDLICGRSKYSDETLDTGDCTIAKPEGKYAATYKVFRSTWKRPRGFTKTLDRIDIEISKGIPIPGKGENSYDIDDDKTFGVTMPLNGRSIRECCDDVARNALKTRQERESLTWIPSAGWTGVAA